MALKRGLSRKNLRGCFGLSKYLKNTLFVGRKCKLRKKYYYLSSGPPSTGIFLSSANSSILQKKHESGKNFSKSINWENFRVFLLWPHAAWVKRLWNWWSVTCDSLRDKHVFMPTCCLKTAFDQPAVEAKIVIQPTYFPQSPVSDSTAFVARNEKVASSDDW